jgi:hypothetical protein
VYDCDFLEMLRHEEGFSVLTTENFSIVRMTFCFIKLKGTLAPLLLSKIGMALHMEVFEPRMTELNQSQTQTH